MSSIKVCDECGHVITSAQESVFSAVTKSYVHGACYWGEPDATEFAELQAEAYYDRPDVIAGEVFQDRLDMYRNEY